MSRPKALISWSSGKDSAFALHEVRRAGEFDVVGALTTVTETFGRVSIHGVRQEILQAQCEAAGLPQRIVPIPYPCPNEVYEARIGTAGDPELLVDGIEDRNTVGAGCRELPAAGPFDIEIEGAFQFRRIHDGMIQITTCHLTKIFRNPSAGEVSA